MRTPFEDFLTFSNWLYAETRQSHKIALLRLFRLIYKAMTEVLMRDKQQTVDCLTKDYELCGMKGRPEFHLSNNKNNSDDELKKKRSESHQKRHQLNK